MLRAFLLIVLPVILPFVVYAIYVVLARRKASLAAQGRLPGWQDAPWGKMVIAAGLLLAATLLTVRFLDPVTTGDYHPPRLIDGRIEPGYSEP